MKEWSAVKALVDKLPDDGDALATLQEGDELSTRMDEGKVFFGYGWAHLPLFFFLGGGGGNSRGHSLG